MLHIYIEATCLTEERMSGIGHATLEITRALEKNPGYNKDFDVTLVTSYDTIGALKRWKFTGASYKKIPIPLRLLNILWKYDLLPPMDFFIKKGVVIFPNYKNWRLLRSKSITYVHDIGFILYPQYVAPKNQKFLENNLPKWLKRTSLVVTDSYSAQQEIMQHYGLSKEEVEVIHHGVDKKFFYRRDKNEISVVRSKYSIGSGKYILYVGNIEPRKNVMGLINSYKALPKSIRDEYRLLLIGGLGWLNEEIFESIAKARAEGFNIVKIEEYVPDEDLPALYSAASLLVLPSHYEGFGLSLVQAMACKTPVLAGNNSSMKEIVGSAGMLVDSNDTVDLSAGIVRSLISLKEQKRNIDLAYKKVNDYSWNKSAATLLQKSAELTKPRYT